MIAQSKQNQTIGDQLTRQVKQRERTLCMSKVKFGSLRHVRGIKTFDLVQIPSKNRFVQS
jgi:hypothetical protein